MSMIFSRRQFGAAMFPALLGVFTSGCGTILYPERRGQPAGRMDWGIVALDALGLILFFVPGVIAFAVDFNNGSIYLPPGEYGGTDSERPSGLRRIDVPRQQLTRAGISRIVSDAVGHSVSLELDTYETRPLAQLDDFRETRDTMIAAATGSVPSPSVMRSQSPPQ